MSTAMQRLDIFAAPLEGLNLIEASAGTGKTYTITGLYLRLVLEAQLPVNRILVVTYTKAATAELRDRIRRRLVQARDVVGGAAGDEFLQTLLARVEDQEKARKRLDNAVRGFDEAAIFTIHGFCQRVLMDSAFESGMPFETELLADEKELLQEIVEDFWRREFYHASPLLIGFLLDENYTPQTLLDEIRSHVGKPYLEVLAPPLPPGFAAAEAEFARCYSELRALWPLARAAVTALLTDNPALNANRYRPRSVSTWPGLMDEYLLAETPNLKLFKVFEKFTASHLAKAVKKGHAAPQHRLFTCCDELLAARDQLADHYRWHLRALRARLLDFCNTELIHRKRQLQVQSYDDLLRNLDQGLRGKQGEQLAARIGERYPGALIDEFQDTDPVQYDIFRRIYAGTGLPVFLVGDPKQAIYSFRGADIFAYLHARQDAARRYTLDVNWRSEPDLIQAINLVLEKSPQPFLFAEIPFQTARAAEREREPLLIEGEREPPFRFWFIGYDENDRPTGKGQATEWVAQATAAEIARLLNLGANGQARIGEHALDGGDIAVLVRSHRQGRVVRDALLALGVPCVQQAQDNVFNTREALDLERLLLAVAEPDREPLVRAALATDMLGLGGTQIYGLGEDEQAWEERLDAFQTYHRLWLEHGFIRMFRTLLSEENVPKRLLGFKDGERRLTNLLHLAELLQTAASVKRIGIEGLIKWLSERRRSDNGEDEAFQLRLESDEHLVKIVTLHKSKGLEYPVVFCPFLWDGKLWADDSKTLAFHDPQRDFRPALDLGSNALEQHRAHARREELAETLRLLYVALTRARHQVYMAWGAIKGSGTSAPAWLLHQPPIAATDLDNVAEYVESLSEEKLLADLSALAARGKGSVRIESLPEEAAPYRPPQQPEPRFEARYFPGPIKGKWRVGSFSALATGHGGELPDYDAAQLSLMTPLAGAARDIFSFPRGARAGRCLHLILEQFDFACTEHGRLEAVVDGALRQHGFEPDWGPVVSACINTVLATPLPQSGVRLREISRQRRLDELAFYYPLANIDGESLRQILIAHRPEPGPLRERFEGLSFNPIRGYMKGFIDLIFEADGRYFLVDYKSNWLGMTLADYHPDALVRVMARESYFLQYLIYLVALHRYLRLRLTDYDYERHFGGVYYLFLRGMDARMPGSGVYRDRPELGLVEALDHYMATGKGI